MLQGACFSCRPPELVTFHYRCLAETVIGSAKRYLNMGYYINTAMLSCHCCGRYPKLPFL